MKYESKGRIEISKQDGNIEIKTFLDNSFNNSSHLLSKQLIDLQDKAIRNALISLGWTPPKDEL